MGSSVQHTLTATGIMTRSRHEDGMPGPYGETTTQSVVTEWRQRVMSSFQIYLPKLTGFNATSRLRVLILLIWSGFDGQMEHYVIIQKITSFMMEPENDTGTLFS